MCYSAYPKSRGMRDTIAMDIEYTVLTDLDPKTYCYARNELSNSQPSNFISFKMSSLCL